MVEVNEELKICLIDNGVTEMCVCVCVCICLCMFVCPADTAMILILARQALTWT